MMRVGLTGGIGSGKSTVAGIFRTHGIPVYDSDSRARELMQDNEGVRKGIEQLLGASAYKEGLLDRGHIASRVFEDRELLRRLNALVHPAVRSDFENWSARQLTPYVIQEAAILFENGAHLDLDRMILVTAPVDERIRRVMERDAVDRQAVLSRMRNQWPDAEKIPLADFVIENIDLENTRETVGRIHRELLQVSGAEPAS